MPLIISDQCHPCLSVVESYFRGAAWADWVLDGISSMRLMARFSTGDDKTMEVEVVPNGVSLSISDSRCSTERTWTFIMKESVPVRRWHSTTSGEFFTTAVMRVNTSP